ncbi:hypothetical protein SORBI_3003G085800 [Sorghum bicolor]|uniref:Uncharacterized protein n=2 Tax=Sorghum bicolor TaxID=4558 RepID=A0A1W0VW85_SORBI|nr:hypothetical protein SORBI_3003G085800 [Sorghum bicolor]
MARRRWLGSRLPPARAAPCSMLSARGYVHAPSTPTTTLTVSHTRRLTPPRPRQSTPKAEAEGRAPEPASQPAMKRTRAQQPKVEEPQDLTTAATTPANPKPQRRAKQPRQPKAAVAGGAKTKPGAAGARVVPAASVAAVAAAAAANAASSAASSPGGAEMMAPTVPDVGAGGERGDADDAPAVDWDLDDDAGLDAAAAWWTWGVDEEKLLGWFPFVEEDFRCGGARAGDAEVAAFDHDIWSIW